MPVSHPVKHYEFPECEGDVLSVKDLHFHYPDGHTALRGVSTTTPSTPFFRYPYFEMTQQTLDALQKRGIVVFGADLWASDWNPMTPEAQLKVLTDRLKAAGKGIILLHDPRAQTAAMLPAFLRYLRDNRYRVVHVVSAASARTAADARPNEIRE
jgi:peptidoglycan/xylan/chitin deacetylase (PgdA/CDA1 family)